MLKKNKHQLSVEKTVFRVLDGIPFCCVNKEEEKSLQEEGVIQVLYYLLSGGKTLQGSWMSQRLESGLSRPAMMVLDNVLLDGDLEQQSLYCDERLFERRSEGAKSTGKRGLTKRERVVGLVAWVSVIVVVVSVALLIALNRENQQLRALMAHGEEKAWNELHKTRYRMQEQNAAREQQIEHIRGVLHQREQQIEQIRGVLHQREQQMEQMKGVVIGQQRALEEREREALVREEKVQMLESALERAQTMDKMIKATNGKLKEWMKAAQHYSPHIAQSVRDTVMDTLDSLKNSLSGEEASCEHVEEQMDKMKSDLTNQLRNVQIDYDACVNELYKAKIVLNRMESN